jgi:hypothetical protein
MRFDALTATKIPRIAVRPNLGQGEALQIMVNLSGADRGSQTQKKRPDRLARAHLKFYNFDDRV